MHDFAETFLERVTYGHREVMLHAGQLRSGAGLREVQVAECKLRRGHTALEACVVPQHCFFIIVIFSKRHL